MKRHNIAGFEFKLFGYTIELVTIHHILVTLAVWKGNKLITRLGK